MSIASDFRAKVLALPKDEHFAGKSKLAELIYQNLEKDGKDEPKTIHTSEQVRELLQTLQDPNTAAWYSVYWAIEDWIVAACQTATETRGVLGLELELYAEALRTALSVEYVKNSFAEEQPSEVVAHLQKIGLERFVTTSKELLDIPSLLPRLFRLVDAYNKAIEAVGAEVGFPEIKTLGFETDDLWDTIDEINTLIDALRKAVKVSQFYNEECGGREVMIELIDTALPPIDKKKLAKEGRVPTKNMNVFKKSVRGLAAFTNDTGRIVAELAGEM